MPTSKYLAAEVKKTRRQGRRAWATGVGRRVWGDKEDKEGKEKASLPISPFPPNPNASPPKSRSLGRLGSE
ncbi:MAG: hypothetical protein ACHBN1_09860 [Heteroscytonema crispum UTEX LB 1556]